MRFAYAEYGFREASQYGVTLRLAVQLYDSMVKGATANEVHLKIYHDYISAFRACLEIEFDFDPDTPVTEAEKAMDNSKAQMEINDHKYCDLDAFREIYAKYLATRFDLWPNTVKAESKERLAADADSDEESCSSTKRAGAITRSGFIYNSFVSSEEKYSTQTPIDDSSDSDETTPHPSTPLSMK